MLELKTWATLTRQHTVFSMRPVAQLLTESWHTPQQRFRFCGNHTYQNWILLFNTLYITSPFSGLFIFNEMVLWGVVARAFWQWSSGISTLSVGLLPGLFLSLAGHEQSQSATPFLSSPCTVVLPAGGLKHFGACLR